MESGSTNLNSPEFDPSAYFMGLLKRNNLKQLVTRNMDIQNEIKSFDHDIQS